MNAYQYLSEKFEEKLSQDSDYLSCVEDVKRCDEFYKKFCETFPFLATGSLQDVSMHCSGWSQELDEIGDTIYYLQRALSPARPELAKKLEVEIARQKDLTALSQSREFSYTQINSHAELLKIAQEEISLIETETMHAVIKENPVQVKEVERCLKEGVQVEDKGKYGEMFEQTIDNRRTHNMNREKFREIGGKI